MRHARGAAVQAHLAQLVQKSGGGRGNLGRITAEPGECQGQPARASVVLPPLSTVIFIKEDQSTM